MKQCSALLEDFSGTEMELDMHLLNNVIAKERTDVAVIPCCLGALEVAVR